MNAAVEQFMTDTQHFQNVVVEQVTESLRPSDLHDLVDATLAAVDDGGGFGGWVSRPPQHVLERYWQGVVTIPERVLFVGRLEGAICGSAQLVRPQRSNQAQAHVATLSSSFVAPRARGHGVARSVVRAVIAHARSEGYAVLSLDVRATQAAAIHIYEAAGFRRWATNPYYALVDGKPVAGHYYTLVLDPAKMGVPALETL
jgi:ribosomal protein S18 acetylase RimI-like enzyme